MSLLFEHVNFIFCSVYKVVNESESGKKSSYLTPINEEYAFRKVT